MANHKSAQKRNRQNIKKRVSNRDARSAVRTTIKEARTAIQSGESPEVLLKTASKALAKGASKGLFHKKNASRRMSRLAKFANKQKAASKKI